MIDTRTTDDRPTTLAEIARAATERRLPPVETWHPERCGDSEMRIARDGTWFHQGAVISRPEMVRLFSTILRRESDGREFPCLRGIAGDVNALARTACVSADVGE